MPKGKAKAGPAKANKTRNFLNRLGTASKATRKALTPTSLRPAGAGRAAGIDAKQPSVNRRRPAAKLASTRTLKNNATKSGTVGVDIGRGKGRVGGSSGG